MFRGKLTYSIAVVVVVAALTGLAVPSTATAVTAAISPYSWDPGLYATTGQSGAEVHAWGQRRTGGAWGTGPVNYQAGGTTNLRGTSSGSVGVTLAGTYCPGGSCAYGSGSGYKSLVQFWNDPSNFIAIGLINDPGVSPSGMTLMVEGSAAGRPVGGYWAPGALTGFAHRLDFSWNASGLSVTIDGTVALGPFPVVMTYPSISFLAAARQTGDIADSTFRNISFSPGSIGTSPFGVPSGSPYLTYSATLTQAGSGTGYSAYLNAHDGNNNAIAVGIQTDTGSPESRGRPYFVWERVQNGRFTYGYVKPAASNTSTQVTLKWWTSGTAIFYVGAEPIAEIPLTLVPRLYFNAEGNARLNGDTVADTIANTQITVGNNCPSYCGLTGAWNTSSFNFHGLTATNTNGRPQNGADFTIQGRVSGLPPGKDWDSNLVAGIGMIAQYWAGQ